MPPTNADGELKTVSIDPGLFGGMIKQPSRSSRSQRSSAPSADTTAKDIASQSAALQAAVEEALASAGQPIKTSSKQEGGSGVGIRNNTNNEDGGKDRDDGELKVVVSDLGTGGASLNGNQSSQTSHKSNNNNEQNKTTVSSALKELNALMARRAQNRLMKTMRVKQKRDDTDFVEQQHPNESSSLNGGSNVKLNKTPPWGNLKNGKLPTLRQYRKTMRADRPPTSGLAVQSSAQAPAPAPAQPAPPPAVQVPVSPPSAPVPSAPVPSAPVPSAPPPTPAQPKPTPTPLAKPEITMSVGKQQNGKVAFILNPSSLHTRKARRTTDSSRRSITSRSKLRRARLLQGGANVPQRLIDVMAAATERIGSVERSTS
jgi:hypothetical protein